MFLDVLWHHVSDSFCVEQTRGHSWSCAITWFATCFEPSPVTDSNSGPSRYQLREVSRKIQKHIKDEGKIRKTRNIEKIRGDQWGEEPNFRDLRVDEDRGCYDEKRVEEARIVRDESLKKNGSSQRRRYKTPSIVSKSGRSDDSNGIRGEDIKRCDNETMEWRKQNFDEVLQQDYSLEIRRRIRCDVLVLRILPRMSTTRPRLFQAHILHSGSDHRMLAQRCSEWCVLVHLDSIHEGTRRNHQVCHLDPLYVDFFKRQM